MQVLQDWSFSGSLVVTIPDATRPLDPFPALCAVASRAPHIKKVVIGLGLHQKMEVPEQWKKNFSIVQHDPDDCVGTGTVDGIVGQVLIENTLEERVDFQIIQLRLFFVSCWGALKTTVWRGPK